MSRKGDTVVVVRKIQILIDTEDAEEVRQKLSETSRQNTTYQILSATYKGRIPMNMMTSLGRGNAPCAIIRRGSDFLCSRAISSSAGMRRAASIK